MKKEKLSVSEAYSELAAAACLSCDHGDCYSPSGKECLIITAKKVLREAISKLEKEGKD